MDGIVPELPLDYRAELVGTESIKEDFGRFGHGGELNLRIEAVGRLGVVNQIYKTYQRVL